MVVLNRIAYLRGLAQFGAKFIFSVSVNPVTGVQKIKVVIDPSCTIPLDQQFCTLNMLEFLAQLCFSHKVADKGHKHTSGISEVAFFITAPPSIAAPPSSMGHAAVDDTLVGEPPVKRIRLLEEIAESIVPAVCAHVPLDDVHAEYGTLDDFLADVDLPNTLEENAEQLIYQNTLEESAAVLQRYSEQLVKVMQRSISGWPPIKDMSEDEAVEAIMNEIRKLAIVVASDGGLSESQRLGAWARAKPFVMDLIMTWKHNVVDAAEIEGVDNPT